MPPYQVLKSPLGLVAEAADVASDSDSLQLAVGRVAFRVINNLFAK